jgi:ribosome-binding protein aMBF1 (putative translation factor)
VTSEGGSWAELRDRRMTDPGALEEYAATRLAFELGAAVRELREQRGWTQTRLPRQAAVTQPAVARFEAGGTVPTLIVLERPARTLDVGLSVSFTPRTAAA